MPGLVSLLALALAAPGPPPPLSPTADNDALYTEIAAGDPALTAPPGPLERLVTATEIAEGRLREADDDDAEDLLTLAAQGRRAAYGRTGEAVHLCRLIAAADVVLAREALPPRLGSAATDFRQTAQDAVGAKCQAASRGETDDSPSDGAAETGAERIAGPSESPTPRPVIPPASRVERRHLRAGVGTLVPGLLLFAPMAGLLAYPFPAHSFADLASDVVIDGDVAWIVGMSKGPHDAKQNDKSFYLRGVLVPMNLHTGKLAGSVIVAVTDPGWHQSAFFGATLHPEGVLATGYGCDKTCSTYRIETSRYRVDGVRTWFEPEAGNDGLAYGSDVAFDGQGRALISAAVTQNGKLRGYVFGRKVGPPAAVLFDHWYPGAGPSEALGIARDAFDRIFPVGYVTVNGETEARVTRIHG